jgi:ribosome-binding protein aMBF1 (putative translation factor)
MEKTTADAVEILHRRYVEGDEKRAAEVEEERVKARVARQIYDLRNRAGLSRRELAEELGATQSVIRRLEETDYEVTRRGG